MRSKSCKHVSSPKVEQGGGGPILAHVIGVTRVLLSHTITAGHHQDKNLGSHVLFSSSGLQICQLQNVSECLQDSFQCKMLVAFELILVLCPGQLTAQHLTV